MIQPDHVVPLICMWRESRSAPLAYEAVAWVILNRVADKRWPNTMTGVCLQPWQFSSFNVGDPNNGKMPNPENVADWKSFQAACVALDFVLFGRHLDESGVTIPVVKSVDPTKGAYFYHDHSILKSQQALDQMLVSWLGKGKTYADLLKYRTVTIGPFDFYRF